MSRVKKGEMFNSIQVQSLPRNTFDLTHQHATTMNFADLVPICIQECIPGDNWDVSSETFIRLQPMITPMMHRCDFTVHYFFVPNRILWDGFESFITGDKITPLGNNTPALPFFNATDIATGDYDARSTLANYFGYEIDFATKIVDGPWTNKEFNALPFAAYQKIVQDYYIPRELVDPADQDFRKLNDGNNGLDIAYYMSLRQKGWHRDYFTSALPYAQKGPAVDIPIADSAVVLREDWADGDYGTAPRFERDNGMVSVNDVTQNLVIGGNFDGAIGINTGGTGASAYDPQGTLMVDPTATTINDLRRAVKLQEFLEKNARAGTRYTESNLVHFGVRSSDARLQRAEYITGIKSPIIVSEVLNTTGTEELPQGNMSGHAIGIGNSYRDKYYCEEHGWLIGILSVTPRPTYATGVPRFAFKRYDPLDWYWNEFANIGEQEIDRLELYCQQGGEFDTPFGYIPRYSEYKFRNDYVTGEFQDNYGPDAPLRTWVMQRGFGAAFGGVANLNPNFINGDIKTVAAAPFAVEDAPIMVQQVNKLSASRLMPIYGTPTF